MSEKLHADRQALAPADADGGEPAPEFALLQGGKKRNHNPRATRPKRVPEGNGATPHVEFVMGHGQLPGERHGHDRKSLVHFPKVHGPGLPAGGLQGALRRQYRRGGEPQRLMRVTTE